MAALEESLAAVKGDDAGRQGRPRRSAGARSPPSPKSRSRRSQSLARQGRAARSRSTGGAEAHQPRQGPLPGGRLHQGRGGRLLRRIAPAMVPHLRGRAADAAPLPEGVDDPTSLLREALPQAPAEMGEDGADRAAERRQDRLLRLRRPRRRWSGWRSSRRSSCTPRSRSRADADAADRARLRPRPGPAGRRRRLLPGGAAAARDVRPLDLECFPKTSGSKGLQVYVPLNTKVTYDETKPFARRSPSCSRSSAPTRSSRR